LLFLLIIITLQIQLFDKFKIPGATLDSNLTMESHIKALSSS